MFYALPINHPRQENQNAAHNHLNALPERRIHVAVTDEADHHPAQLCNAMLPPAWRRENWRSKKVKYVRSRPLVSKPVTDTTQPWRAAPRRDSVIGKPFGKCHRNPRADGSCKPYQKGFPLLCERLPRKKIAPASKRAIINPAKPRVHHLHKNNCDGTSSLDSRLLLNVFLSIRQPPLVLLSSSASLFNNSRVDTSVVARRPCENGLPLTPYKSVASCDLHARGRDLATRFLVKTSL